MALYPKKHIEKILFFKHQEKSNVYRNMDVVRVTGIPFFFDPENDCLACC